MASTSEIEYYEKIMKLEGEERRKKVDEVLDTYPVGKNIVPVYDAWAPKYEEVCDIQYTLSKRSRQAS